MSRRVASCVFVALALSSSCGAPAGDPVVSTTSAEVVVESDATTDSANAAPTTVVEPGEVVTTTTASPPSTRPEGLEAFGSGTAVVPAGPIFVLVADGPDLQRQGLMGVEDLAGWDGMWFEFAEDRDGGFWMKDTLLPLSIAWIDSSGTVVAIADMEPCVEDPCVVYSPGATYRSALEVEQGRLAELGVAVGAAIVAPTP